MKAANLMSFKLQQKGKHTKRSGNLTESESMKGFKSYLVDQIKTRQYHRKPVTVKFVQRTAKKRLKELASLDVHLTRRGKPILASRGFCFGVLIKSGNSSRRRGKGLASTIKV